MVVRKRREEGGSEQVSAVGAKRRRTSGSVATSVKVLNKDEDTCPLSPSSDHHQQTPPSLDLATPTPSASESPDEAHGSSDSDDNDGLSDAGCGRTDACGAATAEQHQQFSVATVLDAEQQAKRLRNVIRNQFDLEILLKHRELQRIEDEIAKIHAMMLQMRHFSQHSPGDKLDAEPHNFVDIYAQYLTRPDVPSGADLSSATHRHGVYTRESSQAAPFDPFLGDIYAPRPQRSATLKAHTKVTHTSCLYRRADGAIVKLVCPKCNRSNFGSVQGFINHCRISHSLEFNSHDAAAARCGVAIDEQDSASGDCAGAPVLGANGSNMTSVVSGVTSTTHRRRSSLVTNNNYTSVVLPSIVDTPAANTTASSAGADANSTDARIKDEKMSNLASYLRGKVDLDLKALVEHATEKVTKGYLFEGEEDFEEPETPLSEDCSPFDRVLAEARKLHLNVDEIRAAAVQAASDQDQNKSNQKKKQRKNGNNMAAPKSPALRCEEGDNWDNNRPPSPGEPLFPTSNSPTPPASNRRMPTEAQPLVTRSKSRAQASQRPPTPPGSDEVVKKDKELNMIGNMAKYIQLSRFF